MLEVAEFMADLVKQLGGIADRDADTLELLAPPETGLPELSRFWIAAGREPSDGTEALHVGHPVLDRAVDLARGRGMVSLRHVPGVARRHGLEQEAARTWQFRNARVRYGEAVPGAVPWAVFHFRVTCRWDEKREDLVRVAVDLHNGLEVAAEVLDAAWTEGGGLPASAREGLQAAYRRARASVARAVAPRVRVYEQSSRRYAEVERARLEEYFAGILADLERRIASAGDARRAALEQKRAQALRDREARRLDVEEKFRVRVSARLACLELVDVPRALLTVHLSGRGVERRVVLSHNALTRGFDAMACEACDGTGHAFYLCRNGHLACPPCHETCGTCGQTVCRACPDSHGCVACGTPVCPSCAAPCGECASWTCPRHAGGCHAGPAIEKPAESGQRPAGKRRLGSAQDAPATPAPTLSGSFRPGQVVAAFGDLVVRYDGLEAELQRADRAAAAGRPDKASVHLRDLAEYADPTDRWLVLRLKEVAKALDTRMVGVALARLTKLQQKLETEWATRPEAPRRPAPPRTVQPANMPPHVERVEALVRGTLRDLQADPRTVAMAVGVVGACAASISRTHSPEGWAGGVIYVVENRFKQQGVADMLGVSAATISERSREIVRILRKR